MIPVDIFDDRQNRLLWHAVLIIYAVMRERDDLERVATTASAWDYLTSDGREVFPPLLMEPTQKTVTERLVQITHRARRGRELCPELDGMSRESRIGALICGYAE
jgi:hypothetical protein